MLVNEVEMAEDDFNEDQDPSAYDQQISTDPVEPPAEEPPAESTEPGEGTEPPATTTEPEATATATATATGPEDETKADDEPEPDKGDKAKIRKLENQINSLHRRIDRALKSGKLKVPDAIDESKAPKLSDFESVEDFERAKSEWEIDARINQEIRKVARQQDTPEGSKEARQDFIDDTFSEGRQLFTDFDEKCNGQINKTLQITNDIIDVARDFDFGDEVTPAEFFYYLAQNPAETAAMSRMNKIQIAKAVTIAEAKIVSAKGKIPGGQPPTVPEKPVKTVSTAPEPIKPSSATVIVKKDPNKMTQKEYEAARAAGEI